MINPPKTLEEAYKTRYNSWAGNSKGNPYEEIHCAYEVLDTARWLTYQCSRKKGHGPAGLYCKQHAKMVEAP